LGGRSTYQQRERCKKIGVVLLIMAVLGGIFGYSRAYENSAEAVTIVVAEKRVDTHTSTDDDGYTTTTYSYHVYTHGGRELRCGTWGSGAEGIYNRLRVDQRYEVIIAGVFSKSDLVAINRHLPRR
jgi:hypothetical protein